MKAKASFHAKHDRHTMRRYQQHASSCRKAFDHLLMFAVTDSGRKGSDAIASTHQLEGFAKLPVKSRLYTVRPVSSLSMFSGCLSMDSS